MQEVRTVVADWEVVPRLQDSTRGTVFSEADDQLVDKSQKTSYTGSSSTLSSRPTSHGGWLYCHRGMLGALWRPITHNGTPQLHSHQMPQAHGDVGQCGSRHGFNSLGAAIEHQRALLPKS